MNAIPEPTTASRRWRFPLLLAGGLLIGVAASIGLALAWEHATGRRAPRTVMDDRPPGTPVIVDAAGLSAAARTMALAGTYAASDGGLLRCIPVTMAPGDGPDVEHGMIVIADDISLIGTPMSTTVDRGMLIVGLATFDARSASATSVVDRMHADPLIMGAVVSMVPGSAPCVARIAIGSRAGRHRVYARLTPWSGQDGLIAALEATVPVPPDRGIDAWLDALETDAPSPFRRVRDRAADHDGQPHRFPWFEQPLPSDPRD